MFSLDRIEKQVGKVLNTLFSSEKCTKMTFKKMIELALHKINVKPNFSLCLTWIYKQGIPNAGDHYNLLPFPKTLLKPSGIIPPFWIRFYKLKLKPKK